MKDTSRKIVYIVISLAVVAIIGMWWINGAELEDAWLYLAGIAIAISGIPITQSKKDSEQ